MTRIGHRFQLKVAVAIEGDYNEIYNILLWKLVHLDEGKLKTFPVPSMNPCGLQMW